MVLDSTVFQVTQMSQMSEKVSLPSLAGDLVTWLQPGSPEELNIHLF